MLTYLEANPSDVPEQTLESLRQKLSLGTAKDQADQVNGKTQRCYENITSTLMSNCLLFTSRRSVDGDEEQQSP